MVLACALGEKHLQFLILLRPSEEDPHSPQTVANRPGLFVSGIKSRLSSDSRKVSFLNLYPWRASGPRFLNCGLRDMNGCDQSLYFCFFTCEEQGRGSLLRETSVHFGGLFLTCMRLPGWLHLSQGQREKSESHYSRKKGSEHFIKGDKLLLSENDETSKLQDSGVSQDLFRISKVSSCMFLRYLCFSYPWKSFHHFSEELKLYPGASLESTVSVFPPRRRLLRAGGHPGLKSSSLASVRGWCTVPRHRGLPLGDAGSRDSWRNRCQPEEEAWIFPHLPSMSIFLPHLLADPFCTRQPSSGRARATSLPAPHIASICLPSNPSSLALCSVYFLHWEDLAELISSVLTFFPALS